MTPDSRPESKDPVAGTRNPEIARGAACIEPVAAEDLERLAGLARELCVAPLPY